MPLNELLQGVRNREEAPYRQLMVQQGRLVYGIALRITGSEADANDVLQEVFMGLPEALAHFDGRNLEAWLTTVTGRQAKMRLRKDRRRREVEAESPMTPHVVSHEAQVLSGHLMESAIRALSPELRAVYVLKEVKDLSHERVAAALGISVGNARQRLFRARREIRRRVGE